MEAPGVAPIGAHYLSTKEEFHAYLNQGRESRNNKEEDGGETEKGVGSDLTEPPAKQSKLEEDGEEGSLPETATEDAKEPQGRKRARGQNKSRPCMKPTHYEKDRLCPSIVQERADKCFFGSQCHFLHDVKEYLAKKPPDLGDRCILYETFGKCIYGATCRFAQAHFGEDCKNVINVDRLKQWEGKPMVKNSLSKELQQKLRKKKVSFEKSNEYLRSLAKCNHTGGARGHVKGASAMGEKGTPNCSASKRSAEDADLEVAREEMQKVAGTIEKDVPSSVVLEDPCQPVSPVESTLKAVGAVMDEDIVKLRPCEKRKFPDYVHRQPHIERIAVIKSGGYQQVYYCFEIMSLKKRTQLAYQLKLIESASGHCLNLGNQGKLDLQGKLYLAPLTTCGNLPFRRICKRYGADVTCGEMAVCTNLLQGQSSEWALLKRHHTEDLFGVQLEGAFPDTMTKCAELLNQAIEVDFVDINVGCPIDLVYKKGGGCALMCRTNKFEQIVRGMDSVLDVPLTVKIRTGVQEKTNLAHKIIPNLREWGAAMVTLHGRSREQRYTKMADWDYIAECAKIASPMPLFGNGDILSFEDANRALQTGVSGIMIARGALIKPWLFTEIKEQRHWDISSSERLDILKDFTNYGLEHWGSDTQGVEKTRKFLLEWLSFLCRYIPAGLLERLPQKINERPPYYVGRDYLETLMASQNVDDWIRISEMLLGPVPSNFTFLPKHKANSYK